MRRSNPKVITIIMVVFTIVLSGVALASVYLLNTEESVTPTSSGAALENEQESARTTPTSTSGTDSDPSAVNTNSSDEVTFTELMNFNSASSGNRSESSLISMYNQWATVLYEDKNDRCTVDGKDAGPKIKIRSYNVETGESVQNENELGCLGGVKTPTAFKIVERNQTLIAFGSASNGNIYYTNIGGFRYGIWGGCEWGWNECTLTGATIVGVYDDGSQSLYGENSNNPKLVYTTGNQIKYTKYYGDGNVDWENKEGTGGYAQTRAFVDEEKAGFGAGAIVDNEVWLFRNISGRGNSKSVRVYGNIAAENISPIATVSGIGNNTEVQGMIKNPDSDHVYLLGWKGRGSPTEAANTEGFVYTVNASSKEAVHAISLEGISNIAQPKNPLIYNNKLYFVSGFVTDTRKGLYECPIQDDGKVVTCSLKTLPAIDGKGDKNFITGLDRIGNNLYLSVSVGDDGSTRLYEYTVDTDTQTPTLTPTPTPTTTSTATPLPTTDPTPTREYQNENIPQCKNELYDQRFVGNDSAYFQRCSINKSTGELASCSGIKTPIPFDSTKYFGNLGELKGANTIIGSSEFVYFDTANENQTLSQRYVDSEGDVYKRTCPKPNAGFGVAGCDGGDFTQDNTFNGSNRTTLNLPEDKKIIGLEEIFYYNQSNQQLDQRVIFADNTTYYRVCTSLNCQDGAGNDVQFFEIPSVAGVLDIPENYKMVGTSEVAIYGNNTQYIYQRLVGENNTSFSRTCESTTTCTDSEGNNKPFVTDSPNLSIIDESVTFTDPSELVFCSEDSLFPPIVDLDDDGSSDDGENGDNENGESDVGGGPDAKEYEEQDTGNQQTNDGNGSGDSNNRFGSNETGGTGNRRSGTDDANSGGDSGKLPDTSIDNTVIVTYSAILVVLSMSAIWIIKHRSRVTLEEKLED